MRDITEEALRSINTFAPVWAASMAGRTKIFTGTDTSTAYVTGGDGRFKIVVNEKIAASIDLTFVILHEIAHIFREDISSMMKHRHMAEKINVAADCIINDSLVKLGIPKPSMHADLCWGSTIYGMPCQDKSINNLINVEPLDPNAGQKATAPGNVTPNGEEVKEEGEGEQAKDGKPAGGVGASEDPCQHVGLGRDPVVHDNMKQMTKSIAAYARSQFFERGFKSKNLSTKADWRRNRSAFAGRTDVVIPKLTVAEYGNEHQGPLINLVLDVSGSMQEEWVATATEIAKEIKRAGLDFDLWLTPMRRKSSNPMKTLEHVGCYGAGATHLEDMSFPEERHWGHQAPALPRKGGPTNAKNSGKVNGYSGADELQALALMETEDPVAWVYIGDYHSKMQLDMHIARNFLHVVLAPKSGHMDSGTDVNTKIMKNLSLPRWIYGV